ncbi:recombinase family protein [Candidatus Omnitrophota bacterium]
MDKCLIYFRVSSKEQKEDGFSPEAQLKLLREYAKRCNFRVVKVFEAIETAKQSGREKFQHMVDFLQANADIQHILVEKTDRLYRNFKDYVTIDELNRTIHLVKENEILNKDSRSHQKFIHGIKVLMAKNYIDNLSEETRKGMLEKAEQGYYPSFAPFGYRNAEKKEGNRTFRFLEIDDQKGPIIQKLFRLYATGSYSLKHLTQIAHDEGLRSKKGNKVHKSCIHQILKNPIYYGDFLWCGKLYTGSHPPIITKDLYNIVQEVFQGQNRPKQTKRNFAYTGLMACGKCGCAITAEIKKRKYIYYHCTHHNPKCDSKDYIREEKLDEMFAALVKDIQITSDMVDLIKQSLMSSHKDEIVYHNRQISALNGRYSLLKKRLDQMYIDKLDGKIPEKFYQDKFNEWQEELDDISDKVERHKRADINYLTQGVHILELANRAYSLYVKQNRAERRKLLNVILSNCTLNDATLYPTYRKPFDLLVKGPSRPNWLLGLDSNQRPSG